MIKRGVQRLLANFGYKLVTLDAAKPTWGLTHFFPMLRQFGFKPRNVWDVGANRGNWTRDAVRYFPDAEYTLVEPQDELKACLADVIGAGHKVRWVNAGASSEAGVLQLSIPANDQSSTFLESARGKGDVVRSIEVPVRKLDEIRASLNLPVPEMLKIDAEGFDLKVLRGATDFVGTTEVILAEAAVGELNFENSASKVIQVMEGHGYRLLDITDLNRTPSQGVLWLCEFAFLRKGSQLFDSAHY